MKPYGSEFKKKIDLKKRLYESGILYFPMPSIVRPIETNSGLKSFSANMNAGMKLLILCKFSNSMKDKR